MNRPRKHNKHLPRNVYLRHGAYWYVKRGKWLRIGTTLKEAMAKYASLYEGAPGSMAALISEALPTLLIKKKPNTAAQYRIAAKRLAHKFADFQAHEVTRGDVVRLMDDLVATPNMANRCLSVLRRIFAYAEDREMIVGNPAKTVTRHEEQKRERLLAFDELNAIYCASGQRLQVIIDLSIRTGQRIGDVLKIHRADLLDDGIRFVQQKTGAKIIVAWTEELEEVVARAKALSTNLKAMTLLHNRRGKTPDYRTVREQWEKACKSAGVPDAHLHDLRAFAATHAKRQGYPATPLLGHSTQAQTVRYLRDRDPTLVDGPSFGRSKDLLDSVKKNVGK